MTEYKSVTRSNQLPDIKSLRIPQGLSVVLTVQIVRLNSNGNWNRQTMLEDRMYYALRLNPGNTHFVIKFINVKYIHAIRAK
jgi:hypothetical protein